MSKRILAAFMVALPLAGCTSSAPPFVAYSTPGWYLERPRPIVVKGPEIFGGPFTYDQCEAERLKWETAYRMLCINEKTPPGPYGPY